MQRLFKPGARAPEYLARDKLAWLLVMQALLVLPLLIYLPVWLWLVWAIAGLWRTQVFRGRWRPPGGAVKTFLIIVCAAGLFASYAGKTGTETMVGLLVCTFVLKLLEVNSARDAQLLVVIGFVIIASQLLFSQTPLAALYSLICLLVLLGTWRSLHLTSPQPSGLRLSAGVRMLLHTLPIMVVMFVVLPRLGPLWAVPNQQAAKTGFSDSMSPGDLGRLAQNRAPAFRVEFSTVAPASDQLYWRGLVLDQFDGRTWRQREHWGLPPRADNLATQPLATLDYQVIMEPHGQPWLFSLMTPLRTQTSSNRRPIRITRDHLLYNPTPVVQRLRYEVSSALAAPSAQQTLGNLEQRFYTQLPQGSNPNTQAMAKQWRAEGLDDQAIIDRALVLFRREFTYSLQPPMLGQHAVDEFLFSTRKGFCEHFASSFSVLLRAAGIPVRVVVGYQGGSWNPLENYLLVRQSDAHAWTEVWFEGEGWRALDPTAAVAPNRIERGLDNALSDDEQRLMGNQWNRSSLLLELQLRWDAATFVWQRWVLNYDSATQEGLLTRLLGGTQTWRIALWLLGFALIFAMIAAWAVLRSHPRPVLRREVRAIQKLEALLAQRGYIRSKGETLGDFLRRVIQQEPQWQLPLSKIARVFELIAYQHNEQKNNDKHQQHLERLVRTFPRP
jgi:transglutaminase-like putative cysteine protease